jgi:hypothetical protein
MFQEQDIQVLVARQFGPSISVICEHFIPVLTAQADLTRTLVELLGHTDLLEKEWTAPAGERHLIYRFKEDRVIPIAVKD